MVGCVCVLICGLLWCCCDSMVVIDLVCCFECVVGLFAVAVGVVCRCLSVWVGWCLFMLVGALPAFASWLGSSLVWVSLCCLGFGFTVVILVVLWFWLWFMVFRFCFWLNCWCLRLVGLGVMWFVLRLLIVLFRCFLHICSLYVAGFGLIRLCCSYCC